jgi:AcrR family transcriptional regulator
MADADARTRLREAALDLFGRQGINATSTRAILSAAGLRNPSAINYHFGSKGELVTDLVRELILGTAPVLQLQIALASGPEPPSVEDWAAVAADSALELTSTTRGCLLARVWWEYDNTVRPTALESFLGSGSAVAEAWQDAVARVLPSLPRLVAVTRNVVMLRTLELMTARRAWRLLTADPEPMLRAESDAAARMLMHEVAVAILSAPTELEEGDIAVG